MHYFSTLSGKELSMFLRDRSSILTSLADSQHTNTYCCEYSIEIPDDGQ